MSHLRVDFILGSKAKFQAKFLIITPDNGSLSDCEGIKEQRRDYGDKCAFFFLCKKEMANWSSPPRPCSLLLAQFESGLLFLL